MYWSLRNRVFAAFSPENYTSTVDENAFNKAAEFLNQHFHLGLVLTGNWLQKNYELKQAIHAQSPDTDPYYVNILSGISMNCSVNAIMNKSRRK